MYFAHEKTVELWRSFSPRRKEIENSVNSDLYSVGFYSDMAFFENFNPMQEFEKLAAIEVKEFNNITDGMETLIIFEGQYAVFHYQGKPSEAQETFRFIYGTWLPNAEYEIDDRPCLQLYIFILFALISKKNFGYR